jgi:hypothetical protein
MPEFDLTNQSLLKSPTEDIAHAAKKCETFLRYLRNKNDILFLTTSTRYTEHKDDIPKSTQLARLIKKHFKNKRITIIDVPAPNIYVCEGNISAKRGNRCGMQEAALKDARKNPSGDHRCWASFNHTDDELWRITKMLFRSKVVVFFGSVRWGQANSIYQKLYERLSWIENRATTLKEKPIKAITKCEAGLVLFGQNWRGSEVLETQKQNFRWFGFQVPDELSFNWQYTNDAEDETEQSYENALYEFGTLVQIVLP